ncbi:UDP-glucose 4-epimerase GalE [Pseudidiomarina insulisalsae]|uniref:UDP-glucose 4-epimerase n=1 Tax=Pseudidiomarina insulisalsae TaxID=575789 RepID=A0A432YLF8_9GAMM|nr:UDP-glucose 4-epimerase GalE [Pseudidiomarina insulisalsae]RUO61793.1 UDP-glucose 4-epimerase GalE [Pseudidiomarina insulisalsae]
MILVTGGAGYIGSHTVVELVQAGNDVLVIDDLSNGSRTSLKRVEQITQKPVNFVQGDSGDKALLRKIFSNHSIDAVIHFAGFKVLNESVDEPLSYYRNNFCGTVALCEVMQEFGVKKMVFSSSAAVYGTPNSVPIREDFPTGGTTNPYGTSKYMVERLLADICTAYPEWSVTALRYFNPVGAHESGLIGEDPNGIPNNLVPYIAQVAVGKLQELSVFGNDYPTADGTGVRDYIHVVDLARGHLAALDHMTRGFDAVNLGTGQGVSVLDMVKAFEAASGRSVPCKLVDRRPGDVGECYADPSYAYERLGWRAELTLDDMLRDTWRWQSQNPDGYGL